jgi:superfamily II DNA or RNA helicase
MKTPYPFQLQAIHTSLDKLQAGVNRQIISIPTGGGKTFVSVKLSEIGEFKRVLFCADAEELIEQSAIAFLREKLDESTVKHIENTGFINFVKQGGKTDGYKIGCIKADLFQPDGDVVIASLQTLYRRLHLLDPNAFDLVIIDECHIAMAKTYLESINFFKPRLLLGITATPHRADNLPLGNAFDEIVYEYGIGQAIQDKYLCELDAIRVKTDISLDKVKTIGGDLNEKQLSQEVNILSRNNLVAQSYLKYAKGRPAIGYSVDIQHAIDLADACIQYGINATAISSKEELTGNRTQKVKDFKAGKYDVVFNCGILIKGFNYPDVGCILHCCPTKSLTKWVQSTGRCSRLKSPEYVSKFGQNAIIIDIVDSTSRHNLINAWQLDKDLPPEERVFISQEKRNKLIAARQAKIDALYKEDKRVELYKIPRAKISNSIRMQEEASEAQLKWIKDLGYDVDSIDFTKEMCSRIIMDLPATPKQVGWLAWKKYDVVDRVVTRGEFEAARKEVEKREANMQPIKRN